MQLQQDALLQGGKYKIGKVIGQGGFGITYLATDTLLDKQICIKEFFMKAFCNRDHYTSHVIVASEGARDQVDKYKAKFIKEARLISSMNNPHIITIYDIFEENGSAYYTMEYLSGGSLKALVEQVGALPESTAIMYIAEIADALSCMHRQKVVHLDVKPSNIMLNSRGKAVLIDFGISKKYDYDGGQTSSTPVGISKGYAPMEQYNQGGVSTFSPETDIYSLGATLYFLLIGQSPKEATVINEEGIGDLPKHISRKVRQTIKHAMQPKRKDRFANVEAFMKELPIPEEKHTTKAKKEELEGQKADSTIGFKPKTVVNHLLWATYPMLWAVQHKMKGDTFKYWHLYANPVLWVVISCILFSLTDSPFKEVLQPIRYLSLVLMPIGAVIMTILLYKESRRLSLTKSHYVINMVAVVITFTLSNVLSNILYNVLFPLILIIFYIKDRKFSDNIYYNAFKWISIVNTIGVTLLTLFIFWLIISVLLFGFDS